MTRRTVILACSALLFALMLIPGCGGKHSGLPAPGTEVELQQETFSFDKNYPGSLDIFENYTISAGDVLDVLFQMQTWLERDNFHLAIDHTIKVNFPHSPELSQEQIVLPNGTIIMPYIGEVYVVGKTIDGLRAELEQRYAHLLRDPEIFITVPDFQRAIKELKTDLHTAPRGLSRLVTVRPDGYVTFPLVGEVSVVGRTISEVNKYLNKEYEKVLLGLHCDLFLERHSGAVIYVMGDVKSSGMYTITKPITVLEALTMAGGPETSAQLDRVVVVRRHQGKMYARTVDLGSPLRVEDGNPIFFLKADDILYIPRDRLFETADVMNALWDIIAFRGWGIGVGGDLYNGAIIEK